MTVGTTGPDDQAVEYLSSHLGYSYWGFLAAFAVLPLLGLFAVFVGTTTTTFETNLWLVLLLGPPLIWIVGTLVGPKYAPFMFQRAGTCTFSSRGIDFRSGMRRSPAQSVHVDAAVIRKVELRDRKLSIIGPHNELVTRIPADLQRLRRAGAMEDWSFAQVLVAFRPGHFVLTDPVRYKQQVGVRPRTASDPPSALVPVKLNRDDQIWWPIFAIITIVFAVVRGLLR
jgi:hypothetical protein